MVPDWYEIYWDDYLLSLTVQSLGCTTETNAILYVNCNWTTLKIIKNFRAFRIRIKGKSNSRKLVVFYYHITSSEPGVFYKEAPL